LFGGINPKAAPSQASQYALKRLDVAFTNFFEKRAAQNTGERCSQKRYSTICGASFLECVTVLKRDWWSSMARTIMSICSPTTIPKTFVSNLVNSLKGVSRRMIRQERYPTIRKKLWGGAL
jgi:hypothetical protein